MYLPLSPHHRARIVSAVAAKSLRYSGQVQQALDKLGAHAWRVHRHPEPIERVFEGQRLVYLTPDAEEELGELEHACVYVVGGIVDRTPAKGLSVRRAAALAIETRRLPVTTAGLQVSPTRLCPLF